MKFLISLFYRGRDFGISTSGGWQRIQDLTPGSLRSVPIAIPQNGIDFVLADAMLLRQFLDLHAVEVGLLVKDIPDYGFRRLFGCSFGYVPLVESFTPLKNKANVRARSKPGFEVFQD